jgi:hypothetical protein
MSSDDTLPGSLEQPAEWRTAFLETLLYLPDVVMESYKTLPNRRKTDLLEEEECFLICCKLAAMHGREATLRELLPSLKGMQSHSESVDIVGERIIEDTLRIFLDKASITHILALQEAAGISRETPSENWIGTLENHLIYKENF